MLGPLASRGVSPWLGLSAWLTRVERLLSPPRPALASAFAVALTVTLTVPAAAPALLAALLDR